MSDLPDEELPEFGVRLRKLRTEAGLSQEALADLIEASVATISRYENGRQAPSKYHRALLAEVFGVPGYSLFEEEHIPNAYVPDVYIETQERVRHAMLMDDYHYVDDVIYRIHTSKNQDFIKNSITQIENYLRCWSFYRQGESSESVTDHLIGAMRLSMPDFSLECLVSDESLSRHLSYIELEIVNMIGVILLRSGDYIEAAHIFRFLIVEEENTMMDSERRFYRRSVLRLNLALAIRLSGNPYEAMQLLKLASKDAWIYGSGIICLLFLIAQYKCAGQLSLDHSKTHRQASQLYLILANNFGMERDFSQVEYESDYGIIIL